MTVTQRGGSGLISSTSKRQELGALPGLSTLSIPQQKGSACRDLGVFTMIKPRHLGAISGCARVPKPRMGQSSGLGQALNPQNHEEKPAFGPGPRRGHLSLC